MTLKIDTQEQENRELYVTVEVAEKRVDKAMRSIARKAARDINFPGFRRGKAPYSVVRRVVGAETLRFEAVQEILPDIFEEVITGLEEEPYTRPRIDDIETKPLKFIMHVPLEPRVALGDYRALRKEIDPIEISDEAIDEEIDRVRDRHASFEEVDRPAQLGDSINFKGRGYLDDDEEDIFFNEEDIFIELEEGAIFDEVPFTESLVGLSVDQEHSFEIAFPDPYEDDEALAGKTGHFTVTLLKIQERILPDVDDEFAQEHGEGDSVEAWRASIADNLQKTAEQEQNEQLLDEMVQSMLENVEELAYAPSAVEAEIDGMIEDLRQRVERSGWDWDEYVESSDRTEQEMREDYEDNAVERLENRLVFQAFLKAEKLTVPEEAVTAKIDEQIASIASDDDEFAETMRNFYEETGRPMIEQGLLMDIIHERIGAIYRGEAPDLAEESSETEADSSEAEEMESEEAESTVEDNDSESADNDEDESAETITNEIAEDAIPEQA